MIDDNELCYVRWEEGLLIGQEKLIKILRHKTNRNTSIKSVPPRNQSYNDVDAIISGRRFEKASRFHRFKE